MEWPFWQYVHPNSGLTPPYTPSPTGQADHPFYPPWYQPSGGTGVQHYSPGMAMPPGGAAPPPMPPGGGPGLPAMPPQGGPPGSISNGQINPRSMAGDFGRGLQFLGRALPVGQLAGLFGSPQGSPDVQKQIQEQFAHAGRPDPFAPPQAQATPGPTGGPMAPAQLPGPMGFDPMQSLREMPLEPQPMQQAAASPQQPPPPQAPQAAAKPPMPPMPPVRPQMPPPPQPPMSAPQPDVSYYNGPGAMSSGAPDQAPGLASPVPTSQNLPDGNLSMMLRALMNRG